MQPACSRSEVSQPVGLSQLLKSGPVTRWRTSAPRTWIIQRTCYRLVFLHYLRTSFCFGVVFGVRHASDELSAVLRPSVTYIDISGYFCVQLWDCPAVGSFFFLRDRYTWITFEARPSWTNSDAHPEAQRSLSDEISPRCGSSDDAHRPQRDQPRYEASSQCWGFSADPSGSTPPSKATSNPTHQDVDCAYWTLAAPGLFTAFDVRASEHRGTFKYCSAVAEM